jgi:NTE family protein
MTFEVADFLREVPVLRALPDVLRDELAARAVTETLHAGEWLFRQGEDGDRLHVVRSGRLEVVKEQPFPAQVVATLDRGDTIGELALLTHGRRAAGVRALRDSQLLTISRQDFETLLETNGKFAVALTEALARQVQGLAPEDAAAAAGHRVLTLVALGTGEHLEAIVSWFLDEVGRSGSVVCVREPEGVDPTDFGVLLDRHERAFDRVVLLAGTYDPTAPSAWTRFCLRQADRAVALTGSTPPPVVEGTLRGADVGVLVREAAAGRAIDGWFAEHGCRARHWLPTDARLEEAVRRLARLLTRRSVGVVLSGGGARAFAHLGAVAALSDAGVTIDRFGGTSMGAFVSALLATGLDAREAAQVCLRELVAHRPFTDYTLPRSALLRGKRGRAMLERVFGDARGDELLHSWFGVSVDLLAGELVVHRSDLIREAVSASISLPGLAPPQAMDGRLLIDGGSLDNLPIDVMADLDEGPVIAVDVMARWGRRWQERHAVGGWRARGRSALGWGPPLPSIMETIAGASVIGSRHLTQLHRHRAALVISPDLSDVELLEWGRIGEIVREGKRATEVALMNDQTRAALALT